MVYCNKAECSGVPLGEENEKLIRKVTCLLLCAFLCFTVMPAVSFAARDVSYAEKLAQDLKNLGLFQGVSNTDFALNRAPTRIEALIMLIRLLGLDSHAKNSTDSHPFSDVPAWANSYVGYAYGKGLTNGTSATTFGTDNATAQMYLTFVLRALGYSDANGKDFLWNNPYGLSQETGILPEVVDRQNFLRADVVLVSYAALSAYIKDSAQSLAQKLITENVFTYEDYLNYYNTEALRELSNAKQELSAEEIYRKCAPGIFYIEVYDKFGEAYASGSGFFLDKNGLAVTNYHVIEGGYSAKITLPETGDSYTVAGVYDYSRKYDWAVIQVDGSDFSSLTMGEESTVVNGATVYAIGSPLGLQNTISQGLISNTKRWLDDVAYIQTSAAISHGSSGGALLNKYGEVIGITSAGFTEGENLGLALPISVIEGYQQGELLSLTVSGINQDIFVPELEQADLSRKEKAVALLLAYINVMKNDEINDTPAYTTDPIETDNGWIEYSLNDNGDGTVDVIVFELYDGNYYYASINLNAYSDEMVVAYFYNIEDEDLYYYEGMSEIYIPTFTQDTYVKFLSHRGNVDRTRNEKICADYVRQCLYFVELIYESLYEIGAYSLWDLGFISY